ncbi:hypothetical protein J4230_05825 [Candidatus Woesearchaeota archaeon]|nr:hypothetical protein [Candidatus Woesearchaeota archaeon]
MKNRGYFSGVLFSIKAIKENLVLYVPDLVFFVAAFILTFIFLQLNNLTSIFGGELIQFNSQIKSIISTTPLLLRLIISFLVLIFINLVIGLGTITVRFAMISSIIKGEKISLRNSLKQAHRYIFPLIWLKLSLLVIYVVPIFILLTIGIVYKPLILISILLILILFFVFRLLFIFIYPTLFIKNVLNPVKCLQNTIIHFKQNKLGAFVVLVFVSVVGFIFSVMFAAIPLIWNNLSIFTLTSISSILYLIIKTLIDISVNLWSTLFIFKNY